MLSIFNFTNILVSVVFVVIVVHRPFISMELANRRPRNVHKISMQNTKSKYMKLLEYTYMNMRYLCACVCVFLFCAKWFCLQILKAGQGICGVHAKCACSWFMAGGERLNCSGCGTQPPTFKPSFKHLFLFFYLYIVFFAITRRLSLLWQFVKSRLVTHTISFWHC